MATHTVQFWFEFASTYSYLAALRIEDIARAAGVRVEWRSFLLGPIFANQGWNDSPFNIYPAKGRYMWRDMERLCEKYALPFCRPTQFPRSGLLAARVACIGADESWCPQFVRAVYTANFADDRDISDAGTVSALLDGLDQRGAEVVERAQSDEGKTRLRRQTEEATQLGIFGAPTFVVGNEIFWGHDRLEDALTWSLSLSRRTGG